jgi:hypothetical protein
MNKKNETLAFQVGGKVPDWIWDLMEDNTVVALAVFAITPTTRFSVATTKNGIQVANHGDYIIKMYNNELRVVKYAGYRN